MRAMIQARQKAGVNSTSNVNISSRPINIAKLNISYAEEFRLA